MSVLLTTLLTMLVLILLMLYVMFSPPPPPPPPLQLTLDPVSFRRYPMKLFFWLVLLLFPLAWFVFPFVCCVTTDAATGVVPAPIDNDVAGSAKSPSSSGKMILLLQLLILICVCGMPVDTPDDDDEELFIVCEWCWWCCCCCWWWSITVADWMLVVVGIWCWLKFDDKFACGYLKLFSEGSTVGQGSLKLLVLDKLAKLLSRSVKRPLCSIALTRRQPLDASG